MSGLSGTVVLTNGGADKSIAANGAYTFDSSVNSGSSYNVTVKTQPTGQACSISNGTGTASANVSNINVSCANTLKIFVTNSKYTGSLGGIAGADAKCAADTNKPVGGATYKAFISDGTNRRACSTDDCSGGISENIDWVLKPNRSYVRADGTTALFTTNANGIFTSDLTNSFSGASVYPWTGLKSTFTSDANCSNWSDGTTAASGRRGNTQGTNRTTAISQSTYLCSVDNGPLICVEQ